ncbi:hypothetical protein ARMSODRAFT_55097 [Armillaria solidipes]|uniref:Uncharacterized protein n=1 Tax=Armillaria solidipes TaxID=1076256 RepID=A0A2H3CRN8_9AGAR|nr:hypothetical protein ARMSODRAFT_55097 [Armillaria solidipes]
MDKPLPEVIVSLSRDLHGPVASKPYARGWLISEIYFFWNKVRRSRPWAHPLLRHPCEDLPWQCRSLVSIPWPFFGCQEIGSQFARSSFPCIYFECVVLAQQPGWHMTDYLPPYVPLDPRASSRTSTAFPQGSKLSDSHAAPLDGNLWGGDVY